MKKDFHPKWYPEAKVECGCGNKFTTGATVPEIKVEVCNACHSFFTGSQKIVDTAGRVTKYEERLKKMQAFQKKSKPAKVKK